MKNVSKIIPCYAADTSGVCSALYEFGGMTVVHDASGCNSTYSTHDEPRWYDMRSDIYISALTETDAIMGNDEKLIQDIVSAAKDRKPAFIALCGSPMPMMTGFDYEAVARDIQGRTGIPTFGLETNGTHSYISGAGMALEAIVREFVHDMPKDDDGIGINIIGATPLDFGVTSAAESLKKFFNRGKMKVISSIGMGGTLDEIRRAASAKVNLVVSYCGLPAARYMEKEFGIPYFCGVPVGSLQSGAFSFMYETIHDGISRTMAAMCRGKHTDEKAERLVIGEAVLAGSIAFEWEALTRHAVDVICPPDVDAELSPDKKDLPLYAEEDIRAYIKDNGIKTVVADPLYKYILPEGCRLIEMPHFAFSGRCFAKDMRDPINNVNKEIYKW
ncbi:nitrogenase component 1 [Ruminococcus albus]|uniref:Nitrogenase component 1 type Oxidoreductase n=1 Tax=Ruminococcus albus TaxID=1264 RepID=A0A1I1NWJ1_RUMAL|nr:nitrogenase component 1 [Ruminococcus albus]SFD01786.1 Nitrogenase component 1 type Oxidoreductase [Ruminococcus albus]